MIVESRDLLAFPIGLALNAISGALNAEARWRVRLAVAIAAFTLLTPFIASPDATILRFLCAGGTVLALFRNLDLYRDRRPWSAGRRIWHLVAVLDIRGARFVERSFHARSWLRAAAFAVPTVISGALIDRIGVPADAAMRLARWACAAVWAYTSFETLAALARGSYRLAGIDLPPLHDDPILSRTLAEFWGRRWNLVVRQMLHDHCFRPLARRRGVLVAALGTFVASAIVHFWLVLPGAGYKLASMMGAFFLVQGVLVVIERAIGVHRWQRPWQHLWTVSGLLVSLPLFLEPLLRLLFD
jgi:hypothetical protein